MTKSIWTLCAIGLLATACAGLPDREPLAVSPLSPGQDEWRTADNVIVVTDASFSMYKHATFPEAKALTQTFIASMPDKDARAQNPGQYAAATVGFGGPDRATTPLAEFDRSRLAGAAADLELLGSPQPTTPLDKVLREVGRELAGQPGKAAIVIFSDGRPNSEERTLEAARALVESVPDGACIHTVQAGSDPEGADFLARLARVTSCGTSRSGASLASQGDVASFTRSVMLAAAPPPPALPPVGAIDPCDRVLRMRALLFGFDQAEVVSESAIVLDAAAAHLRACPDVRVRLEGHTDWIGTEEYNEGLSLRRAEAVKAYLISVGVAGDRLAVEGFGERKPLASNETAEGRAENRRVEMHPRD